MKQAIIWRSNILPPPVTNKISNPVLCKTDKGLIVLQYDHVFELWYDPQNPVIAFKSKVFKWCEVK